jgi:hypothetical protein
MCPLAVCRVSFDGRPFEMHLMACGRGFTRGSHVGVPLGHNRMLTLEKKHFLTQRTPWASRVVSEIAAERAGPAQTHAAHMGRRYFRCPRVASGFALFTAPAPTCHFRGFSFSVARQLSARPILSTENERCLFRSRKKRHGNRVLSTTTEESRVQV